MFSDCLHLYQCYLFVSIFSCSLHWFLPSFRFWNCFKFHPPYPFLCNTQLFPTSLCGVLVCTSACQLPLLPARRPNTTCPHTTCPHTPYSHTTCHHTTHPHTTCHNTTCPYTTYSHTQLVTTQLAHTKSCHHTTCSHTTCPHTTCHTTCLHTTYSHTTCHHTTYSHTTCHHTTYSHTHTLLTHTLSTHNLSRHNLLTLSTHNLSTHNVLTHITLPGRCGTYGTGPAPVVGWGGHLGLWSPRLFAWQALHLATSTFTLRGRRGTSRHWPSFCVVGVALRDIDRHFAWQAWHLWHWAGSVPFGAVVATAVCVAGAALRDIDRHSMWQAWHFAT